MLMAMFKGYGDLKYDQIVSSKTMRDAFGGEILELDTLSTRSEEEISYLAEMIVAYFEELLKPESQDE